MIAALILILFLRIHIFELYRKRILHVLSQVFHLYTAVHISGVLSLIRICTKIAFFMHYSDFITLFNLFLLILKRSFAQQTIYYGAPIGGSKCTVSPILSQFHTLHPQMLQGHFPITIYAISRIQTPPIQNDSSYLPFHAF